MPSPSNGRNETSGSAKSLAEGQRVKPAHLLVEPEDMCGAEETETILSSGSGAGIMHPVCIDAQKNAEIEILTIYIYLLV